MRDSGAKLPFHGRDGIILHPEVTANEIKKPGAVREDVEKGKTRLRCQKAQGLGRNEPRDAQARKPEGIQQKQRKITRI